MSSETVARRYGAALADIVAGTSDADVVKTELGAWEELVASNTDLNSMFANPAISHLDKSSVLEKLLAKTATSKVTSNFLKVLLQNGRFAELGGIRQRFLSELESRSGNLVAKITASRELSDSEKSELGQNLERLTGKRIKPEYIIDKGIIGGVITQVGSTVYDGSVRTQLENLREELVNG